MGGRLRQSTAVLLVGSLIVFGGAGETPAEAADDAFEDQLLTELPPRSREAEPPPITKAMTAASASLMLGDDYYDECGDASAGDIAKFVVGDDQARDVAFAWSSCQGAPMGTSPSQGIVFALDSDLYDPAFAHDRVVVQWMDGYYEAYATHNGASSDFWTLLDWGQGDIDRSVPGRTIGVFLVDAIYASLPLEYYFTVQTFDGAGQQDVIPNPGHPIPTFPSGCDTFIFENKAVVRTTDVDAAAQAARSMGLEVESVAPGIGALTVSPVERLTDLDLPGQVHAARPVAYRLAAVTDPEPSQWAIDQLNLEAAWGIRPAAAVEIAIIDSGVDGTRLDLAGRVGLGYDAVSGLAIPPGANSALHPHGTAVAGIAAGTANNGQEVAGVNSGAIVRPYRVNGHDGPCVESGALAAALDHIATVDSIRIVNMSLGGPVYDAASHAAIKRLAAAGKILVAASGNDGEVGMQEKYPASLPEVIAVGATGPGPMVARYSQPASTEVVAPGGSGETRTTGIATLDEFNRTGFGTGTSYAAPYVSGALSLWLDGARASTDEAREALRAAAVDLPGTTADGYGLLDVAALLDTGTASYPPPTARDVVDTCEAKQVQQFEDIAGIPHEYNIHCVAGWNITSGTTPTSFNPSGFLTRGQTATFLVRTLEAAGYPVAEQGGTCVETGIHVSSIQQLISIGIVSQPPDQRCAPAVRITREVMASWTAATLAAAGITTPETIDWYSDDDASPYEDDINTITSLGIVTGTGEALFGPGGNLRRGQMATFLARALDALLE